MQLTLIKLNPKTKFMRVNIFNQIHKGLRALLYDTSILLQQTDFSNEEEMETAVKRGRITVMYLLQGC